MNEHQLKLDIARAQLGAATDLFIKDRDPISVHVLCCGACELLDGIGEVRNVQVLSALLMQLNPDLTAGKIVRLRNQHWNAMKHFYAHDKQTVRDDTELLATFDDFLNDTVLWQGWHDYQAIVGSLPIEAQVLQVWYFAMNEDKLAPNVDPQAYRSLFPGIGGDERQEQKRRLKRVCERYRTNGQLLADPGTEKRLMLNRRPNQTLSPILSK